MKRFRRFALRFAAALLLLFLIFLGVVGWLGSSRLVCPQRRALQDYHREILAAPANYGLKIEAFTGTGQTPCLLVTPAAQPGEAKKSHILRDELEKRGLRLPPWGEINGTIVLLHGHAGRKEDHLPVCERFCAAGFRCLILDLPGQGDHPAPFGTFGVKEAPLVERIFDEASKRFAFMPAPAFLFGLSQGGAIALQTAARNPAKWQAVASLATFASLDRPVANTARNMTPACVRGASPVFALSVACGTRLRAGFWPEDVRPVDAAAKLHMPVFIGHGELDTFIDIGQAREIFAAIPASRKQFRVVPGADHHHVLSMGSHALYADLCQFFLESLQPAAVTAAERGE